MSPESGSIARLRAVEVSGDESVVEGPLRGYHHETYVVPLPGATGAARAARWKCREPRSNLLWFDRRCFTSEEQLLRVLQGRIARIPDVFEIDGLALQRFVEGRTLGSLYGAGQAVPHDVVRQIVELFGELAAVTSETLPVERRCHPEDRPADGDTAGFMERLICFTEQRVYEKNLPEFEALFAAIGLDGDSFRRLRKHVSGLRERPFCLLHADLHRENFIIDADRRLWTIDWELAMVGDPLYELATHLHLMRYPSWQRHRVVEQWRRTVETVRPGSSNGWRHDLRLLIDYKRAQSVFTDVIREALSLGHGAYASGPRLAHVAARLYKILADAALPLGLESVPAPSSIGTALVRWQRAHAGDVRIGEP
ncbi:aminoglycoside phosphotransferase family protein [Streptomyces sp. TRM S81-3]|uniref:Aminoglycoside phosphotransferase family protein n=1 Tax=Streptomyces griseicoloratus TaxID=2752516 RepID=A0A926LDY0_9ACTN|nr:aminoglycoside phosphotransferase family protein [Streptomyces griseicoloratus]MBD0425001.1 aminoglycoside phosphotransferase family protein [Streptomyces griseicoloratus]